MADISKVTLPNNETYDLKDSVARGGIGNAKLFYGTCSSAAAATEKAVTCSEFTANDLVAGTMINVKFDATNTGTTTSLAMNVNGTGAKRIKYIYNNALYDIPGASYLSANNMYTFRYDGTYWVVQLMYNTNSYESLRDYYFRPYAGSTIYRYKLCLLGEDNRLYPIVTTNQTSTTQVAKAVQTVGLKPENIWQYYSTTTTNAGAVVPGQVLFQWNYAYLCEYNFNATIPAYTTVYLRGTYDKNKDLFYLYDDGASATTSYYTTVPINTANITLSDYFVSGYYYMLVGGSYSSANIMSLFGNHPLYYFDGTNLIPVSTKVAKDLVDNAPYVPTTRKINNKVLSSDITLTASDVGALPTGTLPIASGGTGATTASGASNNLLSGLPDWTAVPTDDTKLIRRDTANSASFGQVKFSTIWSYIKSKTDTLYQVIRSNSSYLLNSAKYVGNATPNKYARIKIPNISNVWTMLYMEVSIRGDYANGYGGKVLINAYHTSTNSIWASFKSSVIGVLPNTIAVYGSDGQYIYIKMPGTAYQNASVDRMLLGDSAINVDASAVEVDYVDTLPSTYQTATMQFYATTSDIPTKTSDLTNDSGFITTETDPTVPSWAKQSTKPTYTASEVGLGNVGNFKAVSTVASQGLTSTEQANARANIGAGTSSLAIGTTSSTAAAGNHAHGNITNGGDITSASVTVANKDAIVINDDSASKLVNGPVFDGSTTTKALTPKGTWETFLQSHQSLAGYVPTSRTINSKALTSDITLTASDVGALPANEILIVEKGGTGLSSLTSGSFLRANSDRSFAQRTPAQVLSDIGAAASGHTHTTTIASGGTSQINLAANTAYTLTAGGTNYVFKTPADSDTKNTAGSTDTSSEIYLVGATSQAANPQTYSHDTARVRANGRIVGSGYEFAVASAMGTTKATMVYDSTLEAIAFQFD